MARAKSERILNLTLHLLSARRYVTRDQIRDGVEGYAGLSDEAFERAFERDKDDLRALGVPVHTGSNSALFDDEIGYRIARSEFELPPIDFTAAQARVLAVAAHVWQQAAMAESTVAAMAKLRAAGVDVDAERITALAPTMTATEPAFLPLWRATSARRQVQFGYRQPDPIRTVDPWRILHRNGAWYVIGWDVGKEAIRVFRLTRIATGVTQTGREFTIPAHVDLDDLTVQLVPTESPRTAVVAIREGREPTLRRQGTPMPDLDVPRGFEAHRITYSDEDNFAGVIRSTGSDVLVIEPASLREAVLAGLRRVAGTP